MNKAELLNPYQAQGLTVALRMLERILYTVDALCDAPQGAEERTDGILVSLVNSLTPQEREVMAKMSVQAREAIRTLAERFELGHETADLAREVHGEMVEMWATLEDTKSRKLRRYGDVDPALADSLDPEIEELIKLVLAMDKILFHSVPSWRASPARRTGSTAVENNYDGAGNVAQDPRHGD